MGQLPVFIEEVPEYSARDGYMFVKWRGLEIALPITVCQKAVAKCNRELDRWHEGRGSVVRFPDPAH